MVPENGGSGSPGVLADAARLGLPMDRLAEFCRQWKIVELALFGSALREDFRPDSDIDLLVTFAPDAAWSLLDHIEMEDELSAMLSRPVDLVSKRGVERSSNWIRRRAILESAKIVYAS